MSDDLSVKESIQGLLKTACQVIVATCDEPVTRTWLSYEQDGGIIGWGEEKRISYRPIGIRLLPFLRHSPALKQMLEAFIENETYKSKIAIPKDEVINNPAAWGEVSIWVWKRMLVPYFQKSQNAFGKVIFDEATFEEFYKELTLCMSAFEPYRVTYVSPLPFVRMPVGEIDLGKGIRIRSITRDEMNAWANGDDFFQDRGVNPDLLITCDFALEISDYLSKDLLNHPGLLEFERNSSFERAEQIKQELSWLLRLVSGSTIDVALTWIHHEALFSQLDKVQYPVIQRHSSLNSVSFGGGNEETLTRIWNRIKEGPNKKKIALPFRRWGSSFDKFSPDDKLIDLWIALESLFAPDVDSEIKFRAALRIARFLGRDNKMRQEIYDDMRHSYDWRSAVVHGSGEKRRKDLAKKGDLEDAIARTHDYLRRAILGVLKLPESFNAPNIDTQFFT